MKLVIHRGAHEVGGSCVELTYEDTTILLDFGLPLDFDMNDDPGSCAPQPLLSQLQKGQKRIDAVILSHAHLDHYGLAGLLPEGVPVYCGKPFVCGGCQSADAQLCDRPSCSEKCGRFRTSGVPVTL